MTETTNYKLKKPDLTDFADVTVLNVNMDTIDTELKKRAGLGEDNKLLPEQVPELDFIPNAAKGAANGVASLDNTGKVPSGQLPGMDFISTAARGSANGVASLGADIKVPASQLPLFPGLPAATRGFSAGNAVFNSTSGRSVAHGLGSTLAAANYEVIVTALINAAPTAGTAGLLGEVYVTKAADGTFKVYNTGTYTGSFSWFAVKTSTT